MTFTPSRRPALGVSHLSVRAQLVLLILVILLPVFSAIAWYLVNERQRARDDAYSRVKALAERTSENLQAFMDGNEMVLSRLANRPQIKALDARQCDPVLAEYASLHPEFTNIVVRDRRGEVVCSVEPDAPTGVWLLKSLPQFGQVLKSDGLLVSDGFFGARSGRWNVTISYPIRDTAGEVAGYLMFPTDLFMLSQQLLGSVPQNVLLTVTDRQKKIVLRSTDLDTLIGKPMPATVVQRTSGQVSGRLSVAGIDGVQRLYAFTESPGLGWRVAAGIREDVAFAASDEALRNGVAAGLALLAASLLMAWRISLRIARPIDALAAVSTRVASGDVDARVPMGSNPREIETVAQEFNRMLDVRGLVEAALSERERRLSFLLSRTSAAIFTSKASGDFAFTFVTDSVENLLGYSAAEFLNTPGFWTSHMHPEDVKRFQELKPSLFVEGSLLFEYRFLHKDGRYRWLRDEIRLFRDARGEPREIIGFLVDITDSRQAQEELRVNEGRFRALTALSSDWYWEQDEKFRFVQLTGDLVELTGLSTAEHIGKTRWEMEALNMTNADWARHRSVLEAHQEFRDLVMRRPDQDGQAFWVSISGMPIFDEDGVFRGYRGVGRNISSQKQAETVLRESEARFRTLTVLGSDWYWEQDEQFRFVQIDGKLPAVEGMAANAYVGRTRWETSHSGVSEAQWIEHKALLEAHETFHDFEMQRPGRDGSIIWISLSGTPIFDDMGVFRGYRGIGRDITAQKRSAEQIHALAFFDALTGLPNRRLLTEQLRKALIVHIRNARQGALLFIDLDNFKTLNDTLGHDVGDILLNQVAARLKACVREADTVARLGGDEFVVILEDLANDPQSAATHAESVGRKIIFALNEPYQLAGRSHRSTPSIGITLFGDEGQVLDELLKQADLAMYQSKAGGRNTLRFFDMQMQATVAGRVAMEAELREALQRQELVLHYQPIVRGDGQIAGAEALVRWQHPRRGLVGPVDFIALAESTGLILPLGDYVLRTACTQLVAWAEKLLTSRLTVSVNVSTQQFLDAGFVEQVLAALALTGADPHRLKLEMTESLLADNVDDIIAKMLTLQEHGVSFSLDDFGTGYSSLSYLKRLPLDQIKIDQSFVRDVLTDPNDAAIARTIVALGDSLGLSVVAEGVETEGQRQFLASSGCYAYQGYLFSRPLPISEFDAFVSRQA